MSNLKCTNCGGSFDGMDDFLDDFDQEALNNANAVCEKCCPKRISELKIEKFKLISRTAEALERFVFLYGYHYNEDTELDQILDDAFELANNFSKHLDKIKEMNGKDRCEMNKYL